MSTKKTINQESMLSRCQSFFNDSVAELKKVTTPTKQETIQATLVTLVIVLFVAICLALLDVVFNNLMGALLV